MVTIVIIDSWTCHKSHDWSLGKKRHTFKLHICTRWKLVTLKWLLKLFLQGCTSDYSIFHWFFVPIIDLRNEIVEFREDRHNWNCPRSVLIKSSQILNNLTIPTTLLIEEPLFQTQ